MELSAIESVGSLLHHEIMRAIKHVVEVKQSPNRASIGESHGKAGVFPGPRRSSSDQLDIEI
jgi:hypothetical protein